MWSRRSIAVTQISRDPKIVIIHMNDKLTHYEQLASLANIADPILHHYLR